MLVSLARIVSPDIVTLSPTSFSTSAYRQYKMYTYTLQQALKSAVKNKLYFETVLQK